MTRAARRPAALATALVLAGCGGTAQQPVPTGSLAAAADQRAARAVATTVPDMNCVAQAFGLQPSDAKSIDQVATVYAWVYCHSRNTTTAEIVPAAVDRDNTVRIPRDSDIKADTERIFPADVRKLATSMPQSMSDLVASLPSGPPPNN